MAWAEHMVTYASVRLPPALCGQTDARPRPTHKERDVPCDCSLSFGRAAAGGRSLDLSASRVAVVEDGLEAGPYSCSLWCGWVVWCVGAALVALKPNRRERQRWTVCVCVCARAKKRTRPHAWAAARPGTCTACCPRAFQGHVRAGGALRGHGGLCLVSPQKVDAFENVPRRPPQDSMPRCTHGPPPNAPPWALAHVRPRQARPQKAMDSTAKARGEGWRETEWPWIGLVCCWCTRDLFSRNTARREGGRSSQLRGDLFPPKEKELQGRKGFT